MKRLIMAAVLATMAGVVVADEAAPAKAEPATAEAKADIAAKRPMRPAFDREKFEARIRARRAERREKVVELLKSAGVEEAKVQGLVDEIDKVYSARPSGRPPRPRFQEDGERPQRASRRTSGAK